MEGNLVIWFAVALIPLILGLGVFYYLKASEKQAKQIASWPFTEGEITYSNLRITEHTGPGESNTYTPEVTYEYRVNDKTYSSNTISILGSKALAFQVGKSEARKIVDEYPIGSKVDVHYDPDNPAIATLETRYSWGRLRLMGFTFLFVGCSCTGITVLAWLGIITP